MKLTDKAIKALKPSGKITKHADGAGLTLEVHPSGSKLWRLRYRYNGKEKQLSLGAYPTVSLLRARQKQAELKADIDAGIDPSQQRQIQNLTNQQKATNTFEAVATDWLEIQREKWLPATLKKNAGQLNNHLLPYVAKRPLNEITVPELLAVLRRIESKGNTDTAHQVRKIAKQVYSFAVATGRAERNTANDISADALKPIKGGHHAAIVDTAELGKLLIDIDGYAGSFVVRAALMLAPLVFLRPGELRNAHWSEFDIENGLWAIPAERMKGRKDKKRAHTVPLSEQALAILKQLHPVTGRQALLFPGQSRGTGNAISDNTLNKAMRRMGYTSEQVTAHGFRASARTILDETLEQPLEVIEAQLAHNVKDANGRAYNRTQHLEKRRRLMQTWADYLDTLKAQARGENVTPIKQNKSA